MHIKIDGALNEGPMCSKMAEQMQSSLITVTGFNDISYVSLWKETTKQKETTKHPLRKKDHQNATERTREMKNEW